jgi:hypothetical protein
LASDFQGYVPVLADLENVVSRAGDEEYFDEEKGDDAVFRDRKKRLTGVASGKSNNLRLNFYDKVLQVQKKGLSWVFDLWERCAGYEAGAATWRNEFQFGRGFLHDRGIETLDDFLAAVPALWAYGMAWYSFRVSSEADSNRSRWAVAAWWYKLSTWGVVHDAELPRVKVVRPRLRRLAAGLAGYLTSFMAVSEHQSYEDALAAALDVVCAAEVPLGFEDDGLLRVARAGVAVLDRKLAAKRLRYAGFTMGAV